jgi:hypothetical protein
MGFYLVIGGIAGVVICILLMVHLAEKNRCEAIQATATELGLAYQLHDQDGTLTRLQHFQLFGKGRHKRVRNVINADTDLLRMQIFDYQFVTGHGKSKSTRRQSVVAIDSTDLDVPQFFARPENFFDVFGSMLGGQDIDFDDDPKFSKSFVLQGPSETQVRQAFHPAVRDFLVQHHPCAVEGAGQVLLFYQPRRRVDADRIKDYMEVGLQMSQVFATENAS